MAVIGTSITIPILDKLKRFLKLENQSDDVLLGELIERAITEIEYFCDRTFSSADHTEFYSGNGDNKLILKNFPINSVTAIYDDLSHQYTNEYKIDESNYMIDKDTGIITLVNGLLFNKGINNIKIIYNAGFSTTPPILENAQIHLAAAMYLESQGNMNVLLSTDGETLIDRPARLRITAYKILEPLLRLQ